MPAWSGNLGEKESPISKAVKNEEARTVKIELWANRFNLVNKLIALKTIFIFNVYEIPQYIFILNINNFIETKMEMRFNF
jgi:hypothetical protein